MYSQSLSIALNFFFLASAATAAQRPTVSNSTLPSGWTYQGCYSDSASNRVLSSASYTNNTAMTEESCVVHCASKGYPMAGVEYADECYCGYNLDSSSSKEVETDCNMACSGNSAEICGAGNRITVFSAATTGPVSNPGSGGWMSLGCYSDSTNARTLRSSQAALGSGMTVTQCTTTCQQRGFQYAGLEYANECYCDSSIQNGAGAASGCNMPCSGNSTEFCGGPNRLNLYQLSSTTQSSSGMLPAGWMTLGCFTDNVSARTLAQGQAISQGSANMSIANCVNACKAAGYSLAGLEYSQECYCDNLLKNGGSCALDQTTCNMPCKGNSAETCGGPNRLNLYGVSGAVASCSATQAPTTFVTSSVRPTSSTNTLTTSPSPTTSSVPTVGKTTLTSSSTSASTSLAKALLPTTSSPPPSSTSSNGACNATPLASTGLITNGDFENLVMSPWTNDFDGINAYASKGLSNSGCGSLMLSPAANWPYRWMAASVQQSISQPLQGGKNYKLTMYQGRPSSKVATDNPSITVYIGNQTMYQVAAPAACGCDNIPCPLQGQNGTVWQKVEATFSASAGINSILLDVSLAGASSNDLLFDSISLSLLS